MAKQILNRREAIYAEEIPPEIADTSGFIEATDYATDTTGGTVKVDDDYGVELTTAGFLRGTVETAAAYGEASNNLLVSKGTLDAVLAAQPAPSTGFSLTEIYTGSYSSGTQSFTYPEGKSMADYSVMGFVGKVGTDDLSCVWIPTAVFASTDYAVSVKIATFSNDEGEERKIKLQVNKNGSGILSGVASGSAKLIKVYVF